MEDIVLDYLKYCIRKMKAIGIEQPVYIMLSLLGVSNYKMTAGNDNLTNTFDRDSLVIPEIVLENFDVDISRKMKPALDIIWNSVGLSESMGYDEQGNRKEESCSHLHWQYY